MQTKLKLTKLEKAVLDLMLSTNNQNAKILRAQLKNGEITSRDYSGTGFFTNFKVKASSEPTKGVLKLVSVHANIKGLQHGAGFVLFLEDGFLSTLEGYCYEDAWPDNTEDFGLEVVNYKKKQYHERVW